NRLCTKSTCSESSLCNLCVLCDSVVSFCSEFITTETQRTQRLHEKSATETFRAKPPKPDIPYYLPRFHPARGRINPAAVDTHNRHVVQRRCCTTISLRKTFYGSQSCR